MTLGENLIDVAPPHVDLTPTWGGAQRSKRERIPVKALHSAESAELVSHQDAATVTEHGPHGLPYRAWQGLTCDTIEAYGAEIALMATVVHAYV